MKIGHVQWIYFECYYTAQCTISPLQLCSPLHFKSTIFLFQTHQISNWKNFKVISCNIHIKPSDTVHLYPVYSNWHHSWIVYNDIAISILKTIDEVNGRANNGVASHKIPNKHKMKKVHFYTFMLYRMFYRMYLPWLISFDSSNQYR